MWGILYGCLGVVALLGGLAGLVVWATWPQDPFAIDDGGWLYDELEDAKWARG